MRFFSERIVDIALVGVIVGGFLASAVLSVVEVSLLRIRKSKVRTNAATGDRSSGVLLTLLDDMPVVLNTVLFTVLACQVVVATVSGYLAQRWAGGIWVSASTVCVSLLLFVYAESIPKTMAVKSPYRSARRWARTIRLLVRVLNPIVRRLASFANWHLPAMTPTSDAVSEPELRLLARQSALSPETDTIALADAILVERSFIFGDQCVADIMVPRNRIVAVSSETSADVALDIAIGAGHRRLPVFGADLDDVVGMVRLRDLAAAARLDATSTVASVTTAPVPCRPGEPIAELMERMRVSGSWLAVVHDDASRTVGLVTVEDVVAELLGEIEEDPVLRTRARRGESSEFEPEP